MPLADTSPETAIPKGKDYAHWAAWPKQVLLTQAGVLRSQSQGSNTSSALCQLGELGKLAQPFRSLPVKQG